MTVRAVTPRIPACDGGLLFWRDADGYDLAQDARWDEVAGSDFLPDPRLNEFARGSRRSSRGPMKEGPDAPARQ